MENIKKIIRMKNFVYMHVQINILKHININTYTYIIV